MFPLPKIRRYERAGFVVVLLVLGAALGCSSSEYEPPAAMLIRGVEPLNINEQGESIPVNVRVLALSSRNLFDREVRVFDALWRNPRQLLEDELLAGPQEATVFPGGEYASPRRLDFQIDLPEETQYVAVLALFHTQSYETRRRYRLVPIEEIENSVLVLTESRIEVVPLEP